MKSAKNTQMSLLVIGISAILGAGALAHAAAPDSTDSSATVGVAIGDTAITTKVKAKFATDDRLKNSDISLKASSSPSFRLNHEPRDGLVTSSRVNDLPILTNNNISLRLPLLRLTSDQLSPHLCNNPRDNRMGRITHTSSSVHLIQLLLDNNLRCLHLLRKELTSQKSQMNQLTTNSLL